MPKINIDLNQKGRHGAITSHDTMSIICEKLKMFSDTSLKNALEGGKSSFASDFIEINGNKVDYATYYGDQMASRVIDDEYVLSAGKHALDWEGKTNEKDRVNFTNAEVRQIPGQSPTFQWQDYALKVHGGDSIAMSFG